jgi:phospholipase/carboxylesterase
MLGLPAHRQVGGKAEPGEIVEDCSREFRAAAAPVDVLEPNEETAAVAPCRPPTFERRAHIPQCRYPVGLGANRVTVGAVVARAYLRSSRRVTAGRGIGYPSTNGPSPAELRKTPSMMLALSGPSQPPASGGAPRQLVILLHGLGADGNDLIGLASYWTRLLPDAEFVSPNAPFPCDMAPYGFQWFSARDQSREARLAGVRAAAPILDAFIDEALAARGLGPDRLALVGFSQGTMMSLFVGLRREAPVAGIVGFSGRLLAPELLEAELRSRPRTLLVHGTEDPLVPYRELAGAQQALEDAGVPVETLTCPGIGHSIDEAGLRRGGAFLGEVLSGATT